MTFGLLLVNRTKCPGQAFHFDNSGPRRSEMSLPRCNLSNVDETVQSCCELLSQTTSKTTRILLQHVFLTKWPFSIKRRKECRERNAEMSSVTWLSHKPLWPQLNRFYLKSQRAFCTYTTSNLSELLGIPKKVHISLSSDLQYLTQSYASISATFGGRAIITV
jgi:hypothetical protein